MTPEQFAALERGDIVRNGRQARTWIVAANNGDHVALVDYRHASNPAEFDRMQCEYRYHLRQCEDAARTLGELGQVGRRCLLLSPSICTSPCIGVAAHGVTNLLCNERHYVHDRACASVVKTALRASF